MKSVMKNLSWGWVLVTLLILVPILALAQEVILTAKDPTGKIIQVRTDSNGYLFANTNAGSGTSSSTVSPASHDACTNTTMNVGTTGTACPPTPRTNRSTLTIQLIQAGQLLTVTSDGTTVATATAGLQLSSSDVFNDSLAGNVNASCRCDAATCSVRITECP